MMYRTLQMQPPRLSYVLSDGLIVVSWDEVSRFLGRPYAVTTEDDEVLHRALRAGNPPLWVAYAIGFVDEAGWCLRRP